MKKKAKFVEMKRDIEPTKHGNGSGIGSGTGWVEFKDLPIGHGCSENATGGGSRLLLESNDQYGGNASGRGNNGGYDVNFAPNAEHSGDGAGVPCGEGYADTSGMGGWYCED